MRVTSVGREHVSTLSLKGTFVYAIRRFNQLILVNRLQIQTTLILIWFYKPFGRIGVRNLELYKILPCPA
jgi:hypothetical protein